MLAPSINEATVRLLTRHGCEVVIADGAGCCGALVHHMGHEETARKQARDNILAWERLMGDAPGDDRGSLMPSSSMPRVAAPC